MRYEARITAYDMLDQICVAIVLVALYDDPLSTPEVVLKRVSSLQGSGESEPTEWIRDALVAALETL